MPVRILLNRFMDERWILALSFALVVRQVGGEIVVAEGNRIGVKSSGRVAQSIR